jgi:hypothetical protein
MVSYLVSPDNIKPRNSGNAEVFGAEFEVRKSIIKSKDSSASFFNMHLSRFFVSANLSLVQSRVDMNSVFADDGVGEEVLTELEVRKSNARDGEVVSDFRPMSGQSPYAINIVLSYDLPDNSTSIALSYNVQGEQLTIIGSGRVPDIYTASFNSLNFNAYHKFGEKQNHRVTLSARNLLDDDRTLFYKSYGAENQIFTSFKPGVGIGVKYTYSF